MSATRIAASFRVSLTALVPKQADSRVAVAWSARPIHAVASISRCGRWEIGDGQRLSLAPPKPFSDREPPSQGWLQREARLKPSPRWDSAEAMRYVAT